MYIFSYMCETGLVLAANATPMFLSVLSADTTAMKKDLLIYIHTKHMIYINIYIHIYMYI